MFVYLLVWLPACLPAGLLACLPACLLDCLLACLAFSLTRSFTWSFVFVRSFVCSLVRSFTRSPIRSIQNKKTFISKLTTQYNVKVDCLNPANTKHLSNVVSCWISVDVDDTTSSALCNITAVDNCDRDCDLTLSLTISLSGAHYEVTEVTESRNEWGFSPPLCTYRLNLSRKTLDGEMNEMTQPSRHMLRISSPGNLRPSTLPLGHRGSQQN